MNRVILDMQTYREIIERIERLEKEENQQKVMMMETEIKDLENQKSVLLNKISEQQRWHSLFLYEQSLRTLYGRILHHFRSLSLFDRIFKYKAIIKSASSQAVIECKQK